MRTGRTTIRGWGALFLIAACAAPPATAPVDEPLKNALPRDAIAFLPDRDAPVCTVVKVVDGDTVDLQCTRSGGRVRLMGFDTPETFQARCTEEKSLGLAAKNYLHRRLTSARRIVPEFHGSDKYNRLLARFIVDGKPLEQIMVAEGVAVYYDGGRRIDWCAKLKGA